MKNDWILDVLTDLKEFARNNSLGALAEQLDDALLIGATELMSAEGSVHGAHNGDAKNAGTHSRPYRSGKNA